MISDPVVGRHYPKATPDFLVWFRLDADCRDYLEWLRRPDGFVCCVDGCGGAGWRLGDGRFMCAECDARTSVTAGTIFDRTRTLLMVWFHACWMFATQKDGVSALSVRKALEISSYETAWAMLHRLRSICVRPGATVSTGGSCATRPTSAARSPGCAAGRQKGKKALVIVAVEQRRKGFGRARMVPVPDATAATVRAFLADQVEPGSTVVTDGFASYAPSRTGYSHDRIVGAKGELPGVHPVTALAKRWQLATHPGSVDNAHLPCYLNELCFRFNRRMDATAACSSCACWSSPSPTIQSAATTSSSAANHRASGHPSRPAEAGTPSAWSGRPRTDPGGTRCGRRQIRETLAHSKNQKPIDTEQLFGALEQTGHRALKRTPVNWRPLNALACMPG